LFHFIYACWNGSGWFSKFASAFNKAVANGVTSPDKLLDVAIKSRTQSGNSLIANGGKKIDGFIRDFKAPVSIQSKGSENGLLNSFLVGIGLVSVWILWRKYKNKAV
jgi:hypothetical protein